MPLAGGDRLGPYEIVEALGAGGMGVVYRAHDPRVGRDVAIKVSNEPFSTRFEREARAIASLNHPNIGQLYDLGPEFLVMELVEGETLQERLGRGPIALDDAMAIAWQIADALAAAHEKGIIHRDLKPANIKIRPDGTAKVLDFGIAKVAQPAHPTAEAATTMSMSATEQGAIVGTAPYMSPEQARGLLADKRTDIWAFGVVLHEMLTGKRLFARSTMQDTLAAVLREEPEWGQIPAKVRRLVRSCLQKDPRLRLSDIADAKLLLDDAPVPAFPQRKGRPLGWMTAAAVLTVALGAVSWMLLHKAPENPPATVRFEIHVPEHTRLSSTGTFEVSPDGRRLVFAATGEDGVSKLWLRNMYELESRPLIGTESATTTGSAPFFWSPDSRFVVFDSGSVLKKVDVMSGSTQTLCELPGIAVGGSWSRDGTIIMGNSAGGILRLSPGGDGVEPLTAVDRSRKEINHNAPLILPGGRSFLYSRTSAELEVAGVYVGSLDAPPGKQGLRKLLPRPSQLQYVDGDNSGKGWLLFHRDGAMMAQALHLARLELDGEAIKVVEPIGSFISDGFFSASANGILVYRSGAAAQKSRLNWVDRSGRLAGAVGEADGYQSIALAPDDKRAAAAILRPDRSRLLLNIWSVDLERGAANRLTFGHLPDDHPVWSSDGTRILFGSGRDGPVNLYQKEISGAEEQVLAKGRENRTPVSLSGDGRFLLYEVADNSSRRDLWVMPMRGDGKPVALLKSDFNDMQGQFSPDMHWIAYTSDESGRNEVYVRALAVSSEGALTAGSQKWIVSKGGGHSPRWRKDGREIFFLSPDARMMAVEVAAGADFRPGASKMLFQTPRGFVAWDTTADGQRFLFAVPEQAQAPFTVVLNWMGMLKR